uniref:Glutaredoxin domain-containing protein n=1 Tax=Syphacia muris TaxID=451379 RepID=A0A0N5AX39_9BILA
MIFAYSVPQIYVCDKFDLANGYGTQQQQYVGYAQQNANTFSEYSGYNIPSATAYPNQLQPVNNYPAAQSLYGASSVNIYPPVTPSINYLSSPVQQQPYNQYSNSLNFNSLQQPAYTTTQQTYTLNSNLQQQQQNHQPFYGNNDNSQFSSYGYSLNKPLTTQLQSSATYPNLQSYQTLTYNSRPTVTAASASAHLNKDNYNLYSNYYGNYKAANSDLDQKNLQRYSQYLDILQKHYGIQLPETNKNIATATVSSISPYSYNGNYENLNGYNNNNYNSITNPTYPSSAVYGYQQLETSGNEHSTPSSPVIASTLVSRLSSSADIYGQSPYIHPSEQAATASIPAAQSLSNVQISPAVIQPQSIAASGYNPYINANSIVDYGNQPYRPTSAQSIYENNESISGANYKNIVNTTASNTKNANELNNYQNINTEVSSTTLINAPATRQTFSYTTSAPITQSISAVQSKEDTKPMTTISTLTQQIRRLPAVFYVDSRNPDAQRLEQLLRETYGLPLVAFYVDKLDDASTVEKLLHQLTAHKGLPYLFICGTFIGSQQHIDNYHKNGQVPQLVEYVCSDEQKKRKKKTSS